ERDPLPRGVVPRGVEIALPDPADQSNHRGAKSVVRGLLPARDRLETQRPARTAHQVATSTLNRSFAIFVIESANCGLSCRMRVNALFSRKYRSVGIFARTVALRTVELRMPTSPNTSPSDSTLSTLPLSSSTSTSPCSIRYISRPISPLVIT